MRPLLVVMKAETPSTHVDAYLWVPSKLGEDFFAFILSAGILQGKSQIRSRHLFLF